MAQLKGGKTVSGVLVPNLIPVLLMDQAKLLSRLLGPSTLVPQWHELAGRLCHSSDSEISSVRADFHPTIRTLLYLLVQHNSEHMHALSSIKRDDSINHPHVTEHDQRNLHAI
jgi:hypothetical protein